MTNHHPESVETRDYKGLEIEVELWRYSEGGGFYALPYIKNSGPDGWNKSRFVLDVERFATKEAALQAAIAEGQKRIDQVLDPDSHP